MTLFPVFPRTIFPQNYGCRTFLSSSKHGLLLVQIQIHTINILIFFRMQLMKQIFAHVNARDARKYLTTIRFKVEGGSGTENKISIFACF